MEARHILILEDDSFLRSMLVEILQARGFIAHEATSATTAMDLIDQIDPDGLIIDLDLGPGPNGLDVIGGLGDRLAEFGVLVLSNYPTATAIDPQAKLPPSVGYLHKRSVSHSDELVEALENVLRNSIPIADKSESMLPEPLQSLTSTQLELLRMIAMGMSNSMIAEKREVTLRSVETLVNRLFVALGVSSDSRSNARVKAALMYAESMGIPRTS